MFSCATPVAFPFGLLKLGTNPDLTGSAVVETTDREPAHALLADVAERHRPGGVGSCTHLQLLT